MPPCHLDQMLRYCGALTQVTGQSSFSINGLLAAVEGDRDTHNNGGSLIQQYGGGSFFIEGKKMIVAMGDKAAPDSLGTILHPFSPTDPAQGSSNFFAYDGKAGGGLSQILSGKLNIAENLIGQIKNMAGGLMGGSGGAGSQGQLTLQNMGSTTPKAGDVLTGTETGGQIQILSFNRSSTYDRTDTAPNYTAVLDAALTDDTNVIAMPEHFTGYASQDYQTEYILTL
jgi:hypothetical protein